ncbi:MAG: DUF2318 domain-containing protein, partial [Synergistaceae bacterium]|nr:DUF2318 domain-containing protein [Synergistaceae bacterium]
MNGRKRLAIIFTLLGILAGLSVFGVRMYDPRGMNLILLAFNRKLVVAVAGFAVLSAVIALLKAKSSVLSLSLSVTIFLALVYLMPPVIQYTREFVYFGESGISTNAMMRALGFVLGLAVCLLLTLS